MSHKITPNNKEAMTDLNYGDMSRTKDIPIVGPDIMGT